MANLAVAVREATDAGLSGAWVERRSGGWLALTPEVVVLREALAGRVGWDSEDEEAARRMEEEERLSTRIVQALEKSGVLLAITPEGITFEGPPASTPEDGSPDGEDPS